MTIDRKDFLSFVIKPSGEVVAAMPHEEEFSVQQIRDQVAGYAEPICETSDGFLLFRNRDASTKKLPLNALATSIYGKYAERSCEVNGFAFLAHPAHVAPYWRRRLQTGTKYLKAAA
jgi:hypothetical protein